MPTCPICHKTATVLIQVLKCEYLTYPAMLDGENIYPDESNDPVSEGDTFFTDDNERYYCSECNTELSKDEAATMLQENIGGTMAHIINPTRADLDLDIIYYALENQIADEESDPSERDEDTQFEQESFIDDLKKEMELVCNLQTAEEETLHQKGEVDHGV